MNQAVGRIDQKSQFQSVSSIPIFTVVSIYLPVVSTQPVFLDVADLVLAIG